MYVIYVGLLLYTLYSLLLSEPMDSLKETCIIC